MYIIYHVPRAARNWLRVAEGKGSEVLDSLVCGNLCLLCK